MRSVACLLALTGLFIVSAPLSATADPPVPLPRTPVCGDQGDPGGSVTFNCLAFTIASNVKTFQVPGSGSVSVRFGFVFREAVNDSELCIFRVDSPGGDIGALSPGEPGYVAAALERAAVIFPSGSNASHPDVTLTLGGGQFFAFFIVPDGTLADMRSLNPTNDPASEPVALFSFESLNPGSIDQFVGFTNLDSGLTQFAFEDLTLGGDGDFDDVVYNVSQSLLPATDTDGDGLPDTWETRFGLDPSSGVGDDGGHGDPDGDGEDNATELLTGGHPRGFHKRYFAEGATSDFFDTRLAFLNPETEVSHLLLRFLRGDGTTIPLAMTVDAESRKTVSVADLEGLEVAEFSLVVESDVAVVADRTMSWDRTGYGSHAETSIAAPATTWYLAEGSTRSNFQLFYLLQNPNSVAATLQVQYLLPPPANPISRSYTLQPNSRFNIWVNTDSDLSATDVSAVLTSDVPIIVERAMYLSPPGQTFAAGHESAGIVQPATQWFFAEGATGPYFDLFVLVANPNPSTANLAVRYLLPGGSVETRNYTVKPTSRFTIWVDTEGAQLADTPVSTEVTSDIPVLVERAMWWPGPTAAQWAEAHNSAGATESGTVWGLAEGEQGGARGQETYILIANTSAFAGQAHVKLYLESGGVLEQTVSLSPNSRTNVPVGGPEAAGGFASAVADQRFGAIVTSVDVGFGVPHIVVERAMYSNAGGIVWAAGTNALATKLQ